jgi:hypothetical protein
MAHHERAKSASPFPMCRSVTLKPIDQSLHELLRKTKGLPPYRPDAAGKVVGWPEQAARQVSELMSFLARASSEHVRRAIIAIENTEISGPNSNSFTHSLLNAIGLAVPGGLLSNFFYPGWDNPSVPFP